MVWSEWKEGLAQQIRTQLLVYPTETLALVDAAIQAAVRFLVVTPVVRDVCVDEVAKEECKLHERCRCFLDLVTEVVRQVVPSPQRISLAGDVGEVRQMT